MFLDPLFDLFRPRYKDGSVHVIITYEDGTIEKKKLEGCDMNDSMGTLHTKVNRLWLNNIERRIIETMNKENKGK